MRTPLDAAVIRPLAAADYNTLAPWYADDGPDWSWLARFASDPLARVRVLASPMPLGVIWLRILGDEAELIDLRVASAARRQGIGGRLLQMGLALLQAEGVGCCHLEVRVSNAGAQALYRRAGFSETGRRRDYYRTPNGREDAILMGWRFSGGEAVS